MKVAIIGTGYIAGRHAAALTAMRQAGQDVEIVAHVDVDPAAAQKASEIYGGKAYESVQAVVADQSIDAAWICVPPFAHGEIERTLLAAGTPMYIEKPVGTDMELPSQLAYEIVDSGLVVNVGYYWRCLEVIPQLRTMLQETPPQLVRIAYHGPVAPAAWWRRQAQSGGQVVEQATHLIDTARLLLGDAKVMEASASYGLQDAYPGMDIATATAALLRFGEDLPASFTASCVLGSFVDTSIEFLCAGRKITLSLKQMTIDTAEGKQVVPTGEDPLLLADKAFLAAVAANDPAAVPCSYAEALRTQQLCYDITIAASQAAIEQEATA